MWFKALANQGFPPSHQYRINPSAIFRIAYIDAPLKGVELSFLLSALLVAKSYGLRGKKQVFKRSQASDGEVVFPF
jgi:hypothetical protein